MYISPTNLNRLRLLGALSAVISSLAVVCLAPNADAATTYTVLHNFGDNTVSNDGAYSYSALVQAQNGDFYGTTAFGGAYGEGTVFQITTQGAVTILHSFAGADGSFPETALAIGNDGNLYGTTSSGGSADDGTIFQISISGAFQTIHQFGVSSGDGTVPLAPLLLGSDGNFYSTTFSGGTAGNGVIYSSTESGAVTVLHSFGDGSVANDGVSPESGLYQATDGNLYGTTTGGGLHNKGTAFKSTTTGTPVTIIHAFGSSSFDGTVPTGGIVQGIDGNFYGTTSTGGTTAVGDSLGDGTVYKITSLGVESVIHSFGDGSVTNDAQDPEAVLFQASDGNFYSTSVTGGVNGEGTVYQVTPAGVVTLFHSFGATKDGTYPEQGLIQAADGNFYGTTASGGSGGVGTVFSINFGLSAPAPTITPGGGAYVSPTPVSIIDNLTGASIYYTTNGSAPTTSSTLYTGPITVSASETIQAIATKTGYLNSSISSAAFIIGQTVPTPSVNPPGGTFDSAQSVTVQDSLAGAALFYTTDGSTPSIGPAPTFSPLGTTIAYTGPISVTASENIIAIAAESGYYTSPATATEAFVIDIPTPTPLISPPGGTFSVAQTVSISDPTAAPGAVILYTTDGNAPVSNAPDTLTYTGSFILSGLNTTVEAIALAPGDGQSAVATATFKIGTQVPAPTFTPPAGAYTSTQTITLVDVGATIYYTTDGTTPTINSPQYSSPIEVTSSEIISAFATEANHFNSSVSSAAYTIGQTVPTPTFSVPGGAYPAAQTLTLTDTLIGATIYYTVDGTQPGYGINGVTGTTKIYTGPISIAGTETINVIAGLPGYNNSSETTATYTIGQQVPAPTVSPSAGPYTVAQSVTLSDSLNSATIYYTLDGSQPTINSPRFTAPINVSSSQTINAIAVATGYVNSKVTLAAYIIGQTVPAPGISPDGGPYSTNQQITLSDALPGTAIYYTTDASAPAPTWTLYTNPFEATQTGSETVTAIASETGYVTSGSSSATFTIEPQSSAPIISPNGGSFTTAQTVTITDPDTGSLIYYTIDGSTPSVSATGVPQGTTTLYVTALTIPSANIASSVVLNAIAVEPQHLNSSVVGALFSVNISLPSPTFSPNGGNFTQAQTVTISDTQTGAVIYYSTNATAPNPTWYQYQSSSPLSVAGTETITAKADAIGFAESAPTTVTFTITQPFAKGLQLISLPYTYTGVDLNTLFGYSGVELAVWNSATTDYSLTPTPPANQIVAGQGYWVRFPQAVNVTVAGTPAPTNTPFIISLRPGWNMIGDPFPSAVALSSLTFDDGTLTYAQASSGTSALIDPSFYAYTAGATGYSFASSLEPDQGCWVYAYSATDLDVPVP